MTTFSTVVYFDMLHSMLKCYRTGVQAQTSLENWNGELAWANNHMPISQKNPSVTDHSLGHYTCPVTTMLQQSYPSSKLIAESSPSGSLVLMQYTHFRSSNLTNWSNRHMNCRDHNSKTVARVFPNLHKECIHEVTKLFWKIWTLWTLCQSVYIFESVSVLFCPW